MINKNTLEILMKPYLKNGAIEKIVPLKKGYSSDKKFVVWSNGSPLYLLRINTPDSLEQKTTEISILKKLGMKGIRCPQPYAAGLFDDKSYSYSLVEYIAGESADMTLPNFPDKVQYRLGREAGQALHNIHKIKIEVPHRDWPRHRIQKYRRSVQKAKELKLSFPGQRLIEDYVDNHLVLLETSRVSFRHDDYHPTNMVIRNQSWAGIIDFNRCDHGDPIEEFYKIPWFTLRSSIPFAKGQVDAYLDLADMADFWARYHLFLAMSFHGSLVWEHRNTQVALNNWREQIEKMICSHDWKNSAPPNWYTKKNKGLLCHPN